MVADDETATNDMHQLLFTWAIEATLHHVQSRGNGAAPTSYAFWLDVLCMPMRTANDDLTERWDLSDDERQVLADRDVSATHGSIISWCG